MKLRFVLSAILLLLTSQLIAQVLNEKKIDSLQLQLRNKNSTLDKAIIYDQLAEEYQDIEPEKSNKFISSYIKVFK